MATDSVFPYKEAGRDAGSKQAGRAAGTTGAVTRSRIVGVGSALPPRCVTNQQLVQDLALRGVETSDEWILARTGIEQRWLAEPDVTSSVLGAQAAQAALRSAGMDAADIDLIICATSTPDYIFPSTACLIQKALGVSGGAAFDVQAVCSGFVYALATADGLIRSGVSKRALVIGAEVFSRILDWKDRTTCVLFGDGAGAVVLTADAQPGVLASRLHSDGRHESILRTAGNVCGGEIVGHPYLTMDGQAVFKLAVNVLNDVGRETVEAAGMTMEQVDWLIPHQANVRILTATARKLGVPPERVVSTVAQHANTSAASVPLALSVAVDDGRVKSGDLVLMEGVGGGFTWAASLVRM
ncbi:MAG TPA: beta-ketoacyl-ACP synthase III [Lautropia sp.]|nr:beta-ketoacyl-ACP synthase III [Lautropia sp.]